MKSCRETMIKIRKETTDEVLTQCQGYWRRNNTHTERCDRVEKTVMFPGWWATKMRPKKKRKKKKWNNKIQKNEDITPNIMLQNNHVNADKQKWTSVSQNSVTLLLFGEQFYLYLFVSKKHWKIFYILMLVEVSSY